MWGALARFRELFSLKRTSSMKKLRGNLGPTGQLAAVRQSPQHIQPLQVSASDAVSLSDSMMAARASGSQIDAVRLATDARSVAADLLGDGSVESSIQGQSPRGEEDTRRVCEILIERLNQDGKRWVLSEPPKEKTREEGIDCTARDGQETLKIQVTRIGTQEFWKTLGDMGRVSIPTTAGLCADALRVAIEHKAVVASRHTLLALNAINTPQHAFVSVIESFRLRHGSWAAGVGFQEIWVVGPIPDLTARLDARGRDGNISPPEAPNTRML
jgi:hypothetical protein